MHAGDIFEIVVKLSTDTTVSIPVSESKYTNKHIYRKGMSYFSYDGSNWIDLYDFKRANSQQIACINAFTTLNTLDTFISIEDYDVEMGKTVSLEANVLDAHNHRVTVGNVTFNIEGKDYTVNVSDGKATFNYFFSKEGTYIVNATYRGIHYNPSTSTARVNVNEYYSDSKISLSFASPRAGENVKITATVVDSNNNKINEGSVTFNTNGKTQTINVNNGIAVFTTSYGKEGNYTITADFKADHYRSSHVTSTINVKHGILATKIIPVSAVSNKNVKITAVVKDINDDSVSSGKVTFNINGEKTTINVKNGQAILNTILKRSSTVYLSFESDEYLSSTATLRININEDSTSKISLTDIETTVGSNVNIVATVRDSSDNLIDGGYVTFTVDGKSRDVNVLNGEAIWNISFSKAGSYGVDAVYTSDYYSSSSAKSTITVRDNVVSSKVSLINMETTVGSNVNIVATVRDSLDNLIDGGYVSFTVEGKTSDVNVLNGEVSLSFSFSKAGSYGVDAVYTSDYYSSSSAKSTITVKDKVIPSIIFVESVETKVDELISITAYVFDSNNNAINTGNVNFVVNSKSYEGNVRNGIAGFFISFDKYGSYDVVSTFTGAGYTSSSATSRVLVTKNSINTVLTIDDTSQNMNPIAKITSDVPFGAELTVGDKVYSIPVGAGSTTYSIPDKFPSGKYNAVLSYAGNDKYNPISVSDEFKIIENMPSLISQDISMYYKDGTRFKARLLDGDGNPLVNKSITFSLQGIDYTRTTNVNGYASIAINLNSGKYDIVSKYDSISNSNNIEVKPSIIAKDVIKYFRNDTQFYATILDSHGNPLKNTNVRMNINGVFYDRTTNDNGIVRLNLNLVSGSYILTVIHPLNGEMHSSNIKILPRLVENHDLVKYYRNASKYSVKVLSKTGQIEAGKVISFNINGVFYTRTTDSNGVAGLNINLAPGTYIITAEYEGSRVSNKVTVLDILKTADLTKKYKTSSPFRVTLLDGRGNPYPNQAITFNINGVFYTRMTNSDGVANLNINLQVGKYIITSSFNGLNHGNAVTIYS